MPFTIFAQRLKEAREKRGMRRNALALAVNVTPNTISAYEKSDTEGNGKKPTLENARAIAQTLCVSLDWLCGLSDKEETSYTDFTAREYLKSLVVILLEMSTNQKELCNGLNIRALEFVKKISDLISVYRAGSLSEDLFTVCVDKVISDYSDLCVYGEALLYDEEEAELTFDISASPGNYSNISGNYAEGIYDFTFNVFGDHSIQFHLNKKETDRLNKETDSSSSNDDSPF
ncbi:MAG: helix-turn-helix domain-containing protein [Bacteroides sp.]|nr:helix-turn-helix domain-containing protein [Eubacterium sp.]MCM1419170.1 helix-turn-helix domain-containing protein [Roseburia sp.]MCM1463067.1 helix-turn-helix domain-containing protein [Bacteroides sp.]